MAIANSYFNSSPITDSDIFVGTKYATNRTVNYTAQSIADYLNINSRISISGQLTFKFTILPNVAKTIAFENGGGDGRLFSSIDKLIVSILDAGGSNITVFLDYLVDGEILLAEQNQPNSFGHYKITSYTVTADPNFYELNLQYIGGNGNIYKDVYYDMTPWASSGSGGLTPTLQQVTTAGNVTADQILVGAILAGNFQADGFTINVSDNFDGNYNFYYVPYSGLYIGDGFGFGVQLNQDASILFANFSGSSNLRSDLLTGTRTLQLPDGDGTLALTTNIPTLTAGTNINIDDTDPLNLIISATGGSGIPTLQEVLDNNRNLINDNFFASTGSGASNSGINVNALGGGAAVLNSGLNVNALGSNAANTNEGNAVNAFGNGAGGVGNTFDNVNLFGESATADEDGQTVLSKDGAIMARISTTELTDSRKYTLQDADGTLAFLSDITGATPTLQEVTTAGSTTTNLILLQDTAVSANAVILSTNGVALSNTSTGKQVSISIDNGVAFIGNGGNSISLKSPTTISGTNTQTLQDASGIIALTSDIPTLVAGTNITIDDTDPLNPIISSTGGGGGSGIQHATASGTDTYTATIAGVTSYADADAYLIRFTNGNTTDATLNINSLGARPLYRNNDGPLLGGDVGAGGEMLCVYNSTTNVFQCIGTSPNSLFAYVTNDDSVAITKGMPVYAFGGTGDRITVKRANNTGDATSAQTVGLVLSTSIAPNQKGFILMQGLLDGLSILPTATWSDGDAVYLGATAGTITNVKPYAPNHLVYLGTVTTASNGAAGRLYVRVQNGFELQELHNVQAQSPSLNDTLWYDNSVSPGQWKTASISTILGYTPGTVTSVAALTLTSISGTDLTSTVAGGTTTPVITLNVPTASATNRGALSSADWTTFNNIILISDGIPGTPVTGGTSGIRSLIKSYRIPANTFAAGDTFEVWTIGSKVNTNTAWYLSTNINTSNTIAGATEIGRSFSNQATITYLVNQRIFNFTTSTNLRSAVTNTGGGLESNLVGVSVSNTTFNTAIDNWLLFAIFPVTGGTADIMNIEKVIVRRHKYRITV